MVKFRMTLEMNVDVDVKDLMKHGDIVKSINSGTAIISDALMNITNAETGELVLENDDVTLALKKVVEEIA